MLQSRFVYNLSRSLTLLSILYRRHSVTFLEQPVKMLHVLVTHLCRDGLNRLIRLTQHRFRFLHALFLDDLLEGHARLFLDVLGKIGL